MNTKSLPNIDSNQPPPEWKLLGGIYLVIYLLDFQVRDWLKADSITEILADYSDPHMLTLQFTGVIAFGAYAFGTYWVLNKFYERYNIWILGLLVFGVFFASIGLRWFLEEVVVKAITGTGNYNPKISWGYYIRDNSIFGITYVGLGLVFYLVRYAAFQTKMRKQSELASREAELKFLRSQVNPHFLFNTLNNLYAMVNRGSEKALPTLEKLSGLLRYSLYEQVGMVSIQREIDYLKDLVHLETLRIDGIAPVEFDIGSFGGQQQLPPLLLVPFVENAFKHGELKLTDHPLSISLQPGNEGGITFEVSNLVSEIKKSKDGTGGIGIQNVRKRLALLYPGRHDLDIALQDDVFTVKLRLYE